MTWYALFQPYATQIFLIALHAIFPGNMAHLIVDVCGDTKADHSGASAVSDRIQVFLGDYTNYVNTIYKN